MKLAIASASASSILLIEERENHLSYANMRRLLDDIAGQTDKQQLVITTHSAFVLNKLGIDRVKLLGKDTTTTLVDLSADTKDYFMKLPGYDTLRLLLCERAILVEGPSDELIVQKAFLKKHGRLPLDAGVDVISVGTAFKRFLEIGTLLERPITVVTDNDGDVARLRSKYEGYLGEKVPGIRILFDDDEEYRTLEPQLLKANSRETLCKVLGRDDSTNEKLLAYMRDNKTRVALAVFSSKLEITFPEYINDAIV